MARVKVKMQKRGSRDLLRSGPVENDIAARGRAMASAAGEGFESHARTGRERALGTVVAATFDAMVAESEGHALTRALDAAK